MKTILIVEDEPLIRQALVKLLHRQGYEVFESSCVDEAKTCIDSELIDLVITDVRLPGPDGTSIIEYCAPTPVLVMTSYASVRSAVDAMKKGAANYIAKPFDHEEMLMVVSKLLKDTQIVKQNAALKSEFTKQYPVNGMIGEGPKMQAVFALIDKVSPTDSNVLVFGESGTGKELVARALHEKSNRQQGPFITVNCAAIPEGLIETELFGHEKGAFTGATHSHKGLVEAADGGTLFLDEIGELPLEAQARLLRLLQEKETRRVGSVQAKHVDIRLVAATHRDLRKLATEQAFREDLYFRLNVFCINLPPLRERHHDLIPMAKHLLSRTCKKLNKPEYCFDDSAIEAITQYSWPGNVRELENAIERAVILCESASITPDLFSIETSLVKPIHRHNEDETEDSASLESYFKRFVIENEHRLSETELAKQLGISRKSLWERRQKLGIPRQKKPQLTEPID